MSRARLTVAAVAALGLGLAGAVAVSGWRPGQPPQEPAPPHAGAAQAEEDAAGGRAARIARAVHADAARLGKLLRFDYQARVRHGPAGRAGPDGGLTADQLRSALTTPGGGRDWVGWYEVGFAWDSDRVVWELRPGEADLNFKLAFGTRADGWERREAKAKTSRDFVRRPGVGSLWDDPSSPIGTRMSLFDTGYLRLTPHRFWWGEPTPRTCHAMLTVPLDELSWVDLGPEEFAGEICDVVEAVHGTRRDKCQRLWVGRESGRVRGALSYLADSQPNELARFDDWREVAAEVWLPFREARTYPSVNALRRTELVVTSARTDSDLAVRCAGLMPNEGDAVQDQRFVAPVDYAHDPARTDEEIRKTAEAKYKRDLQDQEEFRRIVGPLDALVGQPAPALPRDGWVGGERPEVAGKPYLVHFWATWCGPCKADLAPLKALAASGIQVAGMHPPGTAAAEVERVVRDRELGYPTFVAAGPGDGKAHTIGGYPAAVYPYCVLVDARGKVAAHGPLSEVTGPLQAQARLAELAGRPAPALDAGPWFNTPPGGLARDGLKGKVVLLDFWGQWCGPCVTKLPRLEELHRAYKDSGLVVLGVHTANRSDRLGEFLREKEMSFPVVIDRGETAARYRVEAWPTYFLIDRAGRVVWGFEPEPPPAARVEALLKEQERTTTGAWAQKE